MKGSIMLERKVRNLTLVLFGLCLVMPATAQVLIPPGGSDTGLGGANVITGTVFLTTGQRLERRVPIRLRTMTRGDRVATTDEYGNFTFRGLVSGDYTIVIDKEEDLQPYTQVVTVMQVRGFPAQNYNVNIRLTPKPGIAGRPSVINAELAKIPRPALDLYNKAIELAKNGDRPEAIKQLQGAVAEYPEFMLAYNEMGVQYMRLNELKKSDEALQSALKIDNKAFMPMMNRGIVLVMLKRYADAESLLREVVKMKNDQAVGHYFLGQAVAYQGKFQEAEKELLTAIKLGGEEMKEAHRLLSIIYSAGGDKKRAADQLETYLRLAPTTPDAEQLRHAILRLKGLEAPAPTASPQTKPARVLP